MIGGLLWMLLSVPQNLINVICSVLVGIGAGLGAGRLSRAHRSVAGVVLAVVVTAVGLLVTQAVVVRAYLEWATDNLTGVPANPDWDGPIGALRLGLDRAAGRNGWHANATFFWWTVSLVFAATLAWLTARPTDDRSRPA